MEKCYVLFPGKFKPVHSGHVSLMSQYLESSKYDVDLTIIISRVSKEGLLPETSKWFLDNLFSKNRHVKVIIAPDASPIKTVYDMTGQKVYGDGIYVMGTSAKGADMKRAEDFTTKFAKGGKFETPGVTTTIFPIEPTPLVYTGRTDMYSSAPISSTIVRMDIRNDDYENFKTAYTPLLESGMLSEKILKEYYKKLRAELLPIKDTPVYDSLMEEHKFMYLDKLNEGGAAGHMMHPYDVDDFTFIDLKNLITDLFAGRIEDVTEKLDGQNLFASVDEHGNTIFARNKTHLASIPWTLADMMDNPKWVGNPSVQHAFSNAGLTIDKVFKNIPNSIKFFNQDDKLDKMYYRKWVNLEILDTQNFNVIPYVESKVSFHGFKIVSRNVNIDVEGSGIEIIDDLDEKKDMDILQKAIEKTNRIAFKVQITPNVIFKNIDNGEARAHKYIKIIDDLLDKHIMDDDSSIAAYKMECLTDYIKNSARLSFISGDLLTALIKRWIYNDKTENITKIAKTYNNDEDRLISKDEYMILRDFDKNDLSLVIKKIMAPLDKIFINVGNEVLKSISGLANAGHEKDVIKKLKREAADIKYAIENSDDENSKMKLEQSLARLSSANNELNATEGIVFNYQGRTLKLTGSFAPLNQLFGLKFGKFNR